MAGQSWDLWVGMNGAMQVYSFIAPNVMNEFSADAKEFYNYLEQNQAFPASSQNLLSECAHVKPVEELENSHFLAPSRKPHFR